MLATRAPLADPFEGWALELKWDGVRAVVEVRGGGRRIRSRTGNDITGRYPELAALPAALGGLDAVLDGEIVALDDDGRPSFQRLQRRMHVQSTVAQRALAAELPVTYVLFDVLELGGRSTVDLPFRDRRALLEQLDLQGPAWRTPAIARGPGEAAALRAFAEDHGFEGVVAKRLDARYEPGRRSRAWTKLVFRLRQEFVVGGWTPGDGARTGAVGALLLGVQEPGPSGAVLRYTGRVGTGFTEAELRRLGGLLDGLAVPTSPFGAGSPPKGARFVRPELVVEVAFSAWTGQGTARQPSYLGQRTDRDPATVVREA